MGFEAFAIVELMGHARIAGKVSEETIAGQAMLRVDVPPTDNRDAYTKFYSAGAVYCLTPTDEATMLLAVDQFNVPPISPYVLRMPESPLLAEKVYDDNPATYMGDDDYDDDDSMDDFGLGDDGPDF